MKQKIVGAAEADCHLAAYHVAALTPGVALGEVPVVGVGEARRLDLHQPC